MARSSGRRLAHRYESERRAASFEDDLHALVVRQDTASASASSSASATATSTLPPIGPVVKIPLPPAIPTSTSTETPAPVSIPTSISTIIPATCAVVGALLVVFVVWHFWYRRQRRKNKTNNRSTWYIPSKYQEGLASIEPTMSSKPASTPPSRTAASLGKGTSTGRTVAPSAKPENSSDKTETPAAYPPRKVSSTPRAPPRSVPGPSPLRNQSKLTSIPEAKATSQSTNPFSPVSPGATPTEKTAFVTSPTTLVSPPPVAAHLRFSFLRDVNELPDLRAQEAAQRPQPMKRSASLLSARMSVRRKPQRQDTAPAETSQPEVPSLRITDADSPLEDSSPPQHPMAGKLVSVTDLYDATMPDELTVTMGETLRVVECYDDDWCLCERVGRKKGRGILPQLCIMEKGGVQRNMRFSMLMRE